MQDGAGSDDTVLQMVDTKALEVFHVEVLQQSLTSCLIRKHPVVELEGKELITEFLLKLLFLATLEEHFLWREPKGAWMSLGSDHP